MTVDRSFSILFKKAEATFPFEKRFYKKVMYTFRPVHVAWGKNFFCDYLYGIGIIFNVKINKMLATLKKAGPAIACLIAFILLTASFNVRVQSPGTRTAKTAKWIPNGVNLQPSYYSAGKVDLGWSLMKKYGKIKTVRIEIEPDQVENAKRWIREAASNGYTIICTYHRFPVLGTSDVDYLQTAANWWKVNYPVLKTSGNFIINLMNEWGSHSLTAKEYANAYNSAISIVRTVYSGKIIIDLPGYGQETYTAANAVKGFETGGARITDTAIAFSVHIYPAAMVQKRLSSNGISSPPGWMTTADLDYLAGCGRTCMVGEFGNGTAGGADWSALVDHAASKSWPVIAWAWNGDGGNMNMITPKFQAFEPGKSYPYTTSEYFDTVYSRL